MYCNRKNVLLLILMVAMLETGCTYVIRRKGYRLSPEKSSSECSLVFCKNAEITTDCDSIIGTVKLKDSGFSHHCSEADAVAILKNEGCAVGADVINVIDEERPDLSSTCYRVKAQLLKKKKCSDNTFSDEEVIGGRYEYAVDSVSIAKRVSDDKSRKKIIYLVEFGLLSALCTLVFLNVLW